MNTPLCNAAQARQADQYAIQTIGIPSLVLMENAAQAICRHILQNPKTRHIQIVCGPGNNGADGLACARILSLAGRQVQIYLDEDRLSKDEAVQLSICRNLGLSLFPLDQFEPRGDLIIDALFGNGLSRAVSEPWLSLIKMINAADIPVLSIDVPSGLNATTGNPMPLAIEADQTLCLDCLKTGLLLSQGRAHAGKVDVLDIGIPLLAHQEHPLTLLENAGMAAGWLPERSCSAHKGSFGKVLLAGGSCQMSGALTLAALACFHCGCGLLSVFAPKPAALLVAAKTNLAMTISGPSTSDGFFDPEAANQLADLADRFCVLGCGNGMGVGPGAQAIVHQALQSDLSLVIDADGLNVLADHMEWLAQRSNVVLTPHLQEFARLCQADLTDVLASPFEMAQDFIRRYPGVTLVLKSDWTLVIDTRRAVLLNHPNDALAKGGSGDVLCGMICAFLAQHSDPFSASALAVWGHNQAANNANPYSFSAHNLIDQLKEVWQSLE